MLTAVRGNKMRSQKLRAWEKEKRLIPGMIKRYCKAAHRQNELCEECQELTKYALYRLEKCPFKENKQFCSFCKIHCYKPEMRTKMRSVMKYSGPRMIFSHPVFAISHAVQMLYSKNKRKRSCTNNDR